MRGETIPMPVSTSVAAVQKYICCKKGNDVRHQAFVLTSEKEDSYPVVLYVYAQVTETSARVIIEWNDSCGRDYPHEFTTSNSEFSFFNQSLQIDSRNIFNQPINVSVSVKG